MSLGWLSAVPGPHAAGLPSRLLGLHQPHGGENSPQLSLSWAFEGLFPLSRRDEPRGQEVGDDGEMTKREDRSGGEVRGEGKEAQKKCLCVGASRQGRKARQKLQPPSCKRGPFCLRAPPKQNFSFSWEADLNRRGQAEGMKEREEGGRRRMRL